MSNRNQPGSRKRKSKIYGCHDSGTTNSKNITETLKIWAVLIGSAVPDELEIAGTSRPINTK